MMRIYGAVVNSTGLRPVVCIKKEVNATLNGEEWILEGTEEEKNQDDGVLEILLDAVNENKTANYGRKVTYPVDIDDNNADGTPDNSNDNDWMIFYNDENYVYLISEDYFPVSLIDTETVEQTKMHNWDKCIVGWYDDAALTNYQINDSKFMISKASQLYTDNIAYKIVGSLLDTNNWSNLVDDTYAIDAIGSPTIEMWTSSWNNVYPTEKIYCNNINPDGYGYYLGLEENTVNEYYVSIASYSGYINQNKLYFPYKEINNYSSGYMLSSPSGRSEVGYLIDVNCYNGNLGTKYYKDDALHYDSIRPVVCLQNEVKATLDGDVWVLEGTINNE